MMMNFKIPLSKEQKEKASKLTEVIVISKDEYTKLVRDASLMEFYRDNNKHMKKGDDVNGRV
jgi:hypothetical protein